MHKADSLAKQNKLYSALDAYSTAANTMVNQHINGELVYKREILVAYRLGGINMMQEPAENIKSWEMALPHFRSLRLALDEAESFLATVDAANAILAPYDTAKAEDIPYDDLIAQLDALKDEAVTETTTEGVTDLLRIKPHNPLLVRAPVNSFEFQPCGRTPQAECLMR